MTRRALTELAMLGRLTRDLPAFLRTQMTVEQAAATVRRRLETRPERFLGMAERMIYGHPRSPYLRLLRAARCELGDLRALVTREGVDGTLTRLAEAGVYLAFDEFKGRRDAVRGSERFAFAEADFSNPLLAAHFEVPTSGTRGRATRVGVDLAFVAESAAARALGFHALGLARPEHALWMTGPIKYLLAYAKLGQPPIAWFHPLQPLPSKIRAGAHYLAVVGRLLNCPLPRPIYVDLQEPGCVAAWLGRYPVGGRPLCVTTYVSSAVRVAVAARDAGIALAHVTFIVIGEPFTPARQRAVEAVGARTLVYYGTIETGSIALSCGNGRQSDDLHVLSDSFGLVRRTRMVRLPDLSVDALLATSLLPSAPKILLNVETGDMGLLERRRCGCPLDDLGLRDHLSEVRSFEKLTGEGMTFVKTNLLPILEEMLPARFGGASADYQLVEEEGEDGILQLLLLVDPRVGPVDQFALKRAFLDELGRGSQIEGYMAAMWRRAETVQVQRRPPVATRGGKILPFHLVN